MITSTFDLAVAIGAFALLPLIIWINLYNRTGLMGYLWREHQNLARIGIVFLGFAWLAAGQGLATYYGLLSPGADETLSIVLGIPMLFLSLAILAMGGIGIVRYLRSRKGAPGSGGKPTDAT